MQKHQCICGINELHPEHGGRIQAIWNGLQEAGLVHRCHRLNSRKATLEEIQSCHSEAHTVFFGKYNLNESSCVMWVISVDNLTCLCWLTPNFKKFSYC